MNEPNQQKVDKGRLNFRINPALHDKLSEYANEHGFSTVSEAAWFLIQSAMVSRDQQKRLTPPPPRR
jgi:hypothetical protein